MANAELRKSLVFRPKHLGMHAGAGVCARAPCPDEARQAACQ